MIIEKANYENLDVFIRSHQVVLVIYRLIENFPTTQQYLISAQMLRSASSIPANIAEGFGRYTIKEKIRFLYISRGSSEETKYHLMLAKDLKLISNDKYQELYTELTEIVKMLNGLINKLNKDK